jgi:hypothetical protein
MEGKTGERLTDGRMTGRLSAVMAINGDFTPVLAKHSKSFSLIDNYTFLTCSSTTNRRDVNILGAHRQMRSETKARRELECPRATGTKHLSYSAGWLPETGTEQIATAA